ncbi:hypothetical protein SLG_13070 [Sphingobium sp. SYK-6]|uniref:OmpA family protein n=1 Tax=Sphingobium sp. (strain NBRC 103272 / SYK-6) TaxID=627192 RepID=UPI000227739B|nr:OmpA family protein [Sphingobium sp. SYK-6]BAK65982.1 hypothetical protein SLG_13070 [Sphingobium sp. SYK-6]
MRASAGMRRGRWAVSFADLCLLLLGFFVLLQANQSARDQALAGIGSYFGALEAPRKIDLPAAALFQPGEALLSEAGHAALARAAAPLRASGNIVRIQSIGLERGEHRFDEWDLAAARLGAVARALVAAGIPPERLRVAGLAEEADASASGRQVIRLVEKPPAAE